MVEESNMYMFIYVFACFLMRAYMFSTFSFPYCIIGTKGTKACNANALDERVHVQSMQESLDMV